MRAVATQILSAEKMLRTVHTHSPSSQSALGTQKKEKSGSRFASDIRRSRKWNAKPRKSLKRIREFLSHLCHFIVSETWSSDGVWRHSNPLRTLFQVEAVMMWKWEAPNPFSSKLNLSGDMATANTQIAIDLSLLELRTRFLRNSSSFFSPFFHPARYACHEEKETRDFSVYDFFFRHFALISKAAARGSAQMLFTFIASLNDTIWVQQTFAFSVAPFRLYQHQHIRRQATSAFIALRHAKSEWVRWSIIRVCEFVYRLTFLPKKCLKNFSASWGRLVCSPAVFRRIRRAVQACMHVPALIMMAKCRN